MAVFHCFEKYDHIHDWLFPIFLKTLSVITPKCSANIVTGVASQHPAPFRWICRSSSQPPPPPSSFHRCRASGGWCRSRPGKRSGEAKSRRLVDLGHWKYGHWDRFFLADFGTHLTHDNKFHVHKLNLDILVGGIPTPLKNMSSSVGIIIPNIWKNNIHVPNHQPDIIYIWYIIYNPQSCSRDASC